MTEQLRLITDIVKATGDELAAARTELTAATRQETLLRGDLAKAIAVREAAEERARLAQVEWAKWWPEFGRVAADVAAARAKEET